jgi:hypothetical protein
LTNGLWVLRAERQGMPRRAVIEACCFGQAKIAIHLSVQELRYFAPRRSGQQRTTADKIQGWFSRLGSVRGRFAGITDSMPRSYELPIFRGKTLLFRPLAASGKPKGVIGEPVDPLIG